MVVYRGKVSRTFPKLKIMGLFQEIGDYDPNTLNLYEQLQYKSRRIKLHAAATFVVLVATIQTIAY